MKIKRGHYILIGAAVILTFIILAIGIFSLTSNNELKNTNTVIIIPTSTPVPGINPKIPVKYNSTSFNKLVDKVENKRTLSIADTSVKTKLLSLLPQGKNSGVLYKTANIIVDYTSGVDLFQVEILTTNIESAKNEGLTWFYNQGLSKQGACDLPVDFYLNWEIANQLRSKNILFSPLADGC